MPGARLKPFRLGDRSELLVQHLLSSIAFTTPVPRQEDIGVDFLCSLIMGYEDAKLLKAGPFFAVQAKSSTDPIIYEKPHELEWIMSQENPLLVCVADRNAGAMNVYSTWNLLCAIKNGWKGQKAPNCIRLCPGKSHAWDWRGVEDNPDESQDVLLGKPIIRIAHEQVFDESSVREIANVIRAWIALDRENIVNCKVGLNWVVGPLTYETGRLFGPQVGVSFYYHPQNIAKCAHNLSLSAVAVWRILRDTQEPLRQQYKMPWKDAIESLKGILRWTVKQESSLGTFLKDIDDAD